MQSPIRASGTLTSSRTSTPIDAEVDVRETVVLDASALVNLLIGPGRAGEAVAARLAGTAPAAPQLLPFEVANVLRRRRNAGQLS